MSNFWITYAISVVIMCVVSYHHLQSVRNEDGYLTYGPLFWSFVFTFFPVINSTLIIGSLVVFCFVSISELDLWYRIMNKKIFVKVEHG